MGVLEQFIENLVADFVALHSQLRQEEGHDHTLGIDDDQARLCKEDPRAYSSVKNRMWVSIEQSEFR